MGAGLIGAGLLGAGLNIGGQVGSFFLGGRGKLKGKSFTERMARHKYRYQMEDMRAAGLNPMLAAGQSPGSSPSMSGMQAVPNMNSAATAAAAGVEAGRKAVRITPEEGLLLAQANKTNAETAIIKKGVPQAEMQESFWGQLKKIFDEGMGAGLSPLGARNAISDIFDEAPTNASQGPQIIKRTNEWQRNRIDREGTYSYGHQRKKNK